MSAILFLSREKNRLESYIFILVLISILRLPGEMGDNLRRIQNCAADQLAGQLSQQRPQVSKIA